MPFKTKDSRNAWYKRKVYARNLSKELEKVRIETEFAARMAKFRASIQSSGHQSDRDYYSDDSDSDLCSLSPETEEDVNMSGLSTGSASDCADEDLANDLSTICIPATSDLNSESSSSSDSEPEEIRHSEDESESVHDNTFLPASFCPKLLTTVDLDETAAQPLPLESRLFDFMCDHQITHSSMRSLMEILNSACPYFQLPKDPRTLMNRYKKPDAILVETEEFAYLGVSNALKFLYAEKQSLFTEADSPETIKLTVNFDGLPTSKSSNKEVWPILMSTDICPEITHVIGVFYGKKSQIVKLFSDILYRNWDLFWIMGSDSVLQNLGTRM